MSAAIKPVESLDALLDALAHKMTLAEASKKLGVSLASCWRYTLAGCHGVKLATVKVGGRRYVLPDALSDFIAGCTAVGNGESPPTPASVARSQAKRRERVNAECEAAGI